MWCSYRIINIFYKDGKSCLSKAKYKEIDTKKLLCESHMYKTIDDIHNEQGKGPDYNQEDYFDLFEKLENKRHCREYSKDEIEKVEQEQFRR